MKYFKFIIYTLINISFIYIIINLNTSINEISNILVTFFKTLFPYLLSFLIINQLLIKTKIIYLISSFLEIILYPLFKINSKEIALILISILNGFPSSMIYSDIMKKSGDLDDNQTKRIAPLFFLPSYTFLFFLIKSNLEYSYFLLLIFSLYIPILINLFITRNKSTSNPSNKTIVKEITISFNEFDYQNSLKEIFLNSMYTIINILGSICFYSLITLVFPSLFIKGLFEFSIPSNKILTSNIPSSNKTLLLLIILTFSSLSSITQASIYMDTNSITIKEFIKKRITMLFLSLIIFNLGLYVYFL